MTDSDRNGPRPSALAGDADAAADTLGAGQGGVGARHFGHPCGDVVGHGGHAGAGEVHMQGQALAGGRAPAVLVEQLLEEVEPLLVMVEQIEAAAQPVAELDLAQVTGVELGGVGRQPALDHVVRAEAHPGECLVGAAVHDHGIIAHVHVAVIVDPPLLDSVKAGHEGRGIGHGTDRLKKRRACVLGGFVAGLQWFRARALTHGPRIRALEFGPPPPDYRHGNARRPSWRASLDDGFSSRRVPRASWHSRRWQDRDTSAGSRSWPPRRSMRRTAWRSGAPTRWRISPKAPPCRARPITRWSGTARHGISPAPTTARPLPTIPGPMRRNMAASAPGRWRRRASSIPRSPTTGPSWMTSSTSISTTTFRHAGRRTSPASSRRAMTAGRKS